MGSSESQLKEGQRLMPEEAEPYPWTYKKLLSGFSEMSINQLQLIQKAAAKLVVKMVQHIIGVPLPASADLQLTQCMRRAHSIIQDPRIPTTDCLPSSHHRDGTGALEPAPAGSETAFSNTIILLNSHNQN
ncbi:hypothetical protein NQZ68_003574 [Dissostichus eleginoides]|nr:hypothetical protein NQZ68_003574 [Dissostichus eleginoides]